MLLLKMKFCYRSFQTRFQPFKSRWLHEAAHRLTTIFCSCSICPAKCGQKRFPSGLFCTIEFCFVSWWAAGREAGRAFILTIPALPLPPLCWPHLWLQLLHFCPVSIVWTFSHFPVSLSSRHPFPTCFLSLVTLTPSSPAPSLSWLLIRSGT